MIDHHVLYLPHEVPPVINSPLIVQHNIPGVLGDVMLARYNGFSYGSCQFVCFSDPDDIVIDSCFDQLIEPLLSDNSLGGVYSNSLINGKERLYKPHTWSLLYHTSVTIPVHQLVIIRRSVINQALIDLSQTVHYNSNVIPEQLIFAHCALLAPFKFVNVVGYHWFDHSGGHHRQLDRETYFNARKYIKNLLT